MPACSKTRPFFSNTLDFDVRRDRFTLIHAVAGDPIALKIEIAPTDSVTALHTKMQALRDKGEDFRHLDQLAQAIALTESGLRPL